MAMTMPVSQFPSADEIRQALLARCDALMAKTGISQSALSRKLTGDSNVMLRLRRGANLTLNKYDLCMRQLDRLFREAEEGSTNGAKSNGAE